MESKINSNIKSNLKYVMNNNTPLYILTVCVLLYVIILPNIDYDLLQLINSVPVKMIFTLLIIYCATISPSIGIIILLIYVLSIQQYNTTKSVEGFTSIIDKLYDNVKDIFKTNDSSNSNASKIGNPSLAKTDTDFKDDNYKNDNYKNDKYKNDNYNCNNNTDLGKLCDCPLVKDQPKHENNKDPRDSRDYKIDDLPIFTPIVPVRD